MKILLFGANGQVGNELRRTLLLHGEVVPLTRADVDLTDVDSIVRAIRQHEPTVIANAAAYTAVDKAESESELASAINRDAVGAMAECARSLGALLIHYSTDYVFDGSGTEPYRTTDLTAPMGVYGATKREGEQAVAESGCEHLIFRTSWVYSSHGHNFIKTMLKLGQERETLRVVSDQVGAPTSAELIADVTSVALSGYHSNVLKGGLYHLTAGGETSWHGLATYALSCARNYGMQLRVSPENIEPISTDEFPTPAARPANSRMNTEALELALKIQMPDWKRHVDRVVKQLVG